MIRCPACNIDNPVENNHCTHCSASLRQLRASYYLDRAAASIARGEPGDAAAALEQITSARDRDKTEGAVEPRIRARTHLLQATIYYNHGQTALAADAVQAALALLEGDEEGKSELAEALSIKGNIAYLRNEMNTAQDCYLQAVQLAEQVHATELAIKLWLNLGNLSINQGRTYEALFRYNKVVQHAELNRDPTTLTMCYRTLCYIYLMIGPLSRTVEYAMRIIKLLPQITNQDRACHAMIVVGLVYRYVGNLEQSRGYIQAALEIAEHSADKVAEADALAKLGQVYLDSGDYERAFATAQRLFGDEAAPLILQKEAASQLMQYHVARRDFVAARRYVDWIRKVEREQASHEQEHLYLPLALYFTAVDDWPLAEQLFTQAIAQSKQRGDAYQLGHDYLEYAKAMLRHAEVNHTQAMQMLKQAAAVFRKVGATYNLAAVEALLQKRDATPALGNPSE